MKARIPIRPVVWIILLLACLYLWGIGIQLLAISPPKESLGNLFSMVVAPPMGLAAASDRTLSTTTTMSSSYLPMFMFQSITTGTHHPDQQRTVLSFTTVPEDLYNLATMVEDMVYNQSYHIFDAIHINIPWIPIRYPGYAFPHAQGLSDMFPDDPRVIIHRLADYGPMTRYVGALAFEQHPDTIIITFDVDTDQYDIDPLRRLIQASHGIDPNAIWCNYGEDFTVVNEAIRPYWDTYDAYLSKDQTLAWNQVYFCRAARGFLVKPKFFQHFALNATDYHRSCFWDDDRFLSFQMAVLGIQRKSVHTGDWYTKEYLPRQEQKRKCQTEASSIPKVQQPEQHRRLGSLSEVNVRNRADHHCTMAFLKTHPDLFPLAYNVTQPCPNEQLQIKAKTSFYNFL